MEEECIIKKLSEFNDGALVANKDSILDALDSLDLVQLSQFISEIFSININLEDITSENFSTLERVVALVLAKLEQKRG